MTYILWNEPFYVDPTTGEAYADYQTGTIPVPKYGNYGGAFSDPHSFPNVVYVDESDKFYAQHDIASAQAGSDEAAQADADIELITQPHL